MTDFNVTVTDQDQHVVDVEAQVYVVRAQETGLLVATEESVQSVTPQAVAPVVVEASETHQQVVVTEQSVLVQEGGGVGLTVEQTVGANTFLALTDTPGAYSGASGYVARVKSTLDGLEFVDLGISALEGRVVSLEDGLAVVVSDIGSLTTTVGGHTTTLSGHASSILQLQADVDAAEGLISSHASLIAGVQADVTSLDNSINAHAGSLAALDSRVTVNEGAISANSSLILQVQTDLSTAEGTISANSSAISSLQSSVSDLDGDVVALAAAVDAVEATHTSMNNNITANANGITALGVLITANEDAITAVASDVSALEVDLASTDANVSANAADILTAQGDINTLEGTVSAHASSITTLQATVVNNTTGISNNASATAALAVDVGDLEDDVYASYTVTLDVNGKITGIELIGGGSSSAFNVRADYFNLYSSAGALSIYGDSSGFMYVQTTKKLIFIGHATTPGIASFKYSTTAESVIGQYANALSIASVETGGVYCDCQMYFEDIVVQARGDISLQGDVASGGGSATLSAGSCGFEAQSGSDGYLRFAATYGATSTRNLYFRYKSTTYAFYPNDNGVINLGLPSNAWLYAYFTANLYFVGASCFLNTSTADGNGNATFRCYGTVGSPGYASIMQLCSSSDSGFGQYRAYYGSYSGSKFIFMYHDTSYGYFGSYYGTVKIYAANTEAMRITSAGDVSIGGSLYENAWSLDNEVVDRKKWDMLASIVDAYKHHDGSKLAQELRREASFETCSVLDADGKIKEVKSETRYGRSNSDLIQVATACIAELLERVEKLEKAA